MPPVALPQLPVAPFHHHARLRGRTLAEVGRLAGMGQPNRLSHGARTIGWATADRAAVALGMHPCEIWGAEWWAIADAYDQARHAAAERQRAAKDAYEKQPAVRARRNAHARAKRAEAAA